LGHKVHPTGFRLGIIKDWQSKWYSDTSYAEFVQEDNKLREEIKSKYREAAISLIEIDRQAKDITITLHTARPGIVIGRGGQRVDEMRLHLENLVGKRIRLNIQEVRQPELDAYLVARSVAEQMERRIAYRRAMRQAMFRTVQAGAKGIKISVAGRLGGAEIARRQTAHEGQVPLHTLRADIDYGFTEARTTMGRIGIKVWIYKGQILPEVKVVETEEKPEEEEAEATMEEAITTEAAVEEVTTAEPEEKPAEAVVEEATTAEPKEKPDEVVVEEATTAEPKEKPDEAVVEEATTAEKKEKPSEAKTAAASSEVEKKPSKPRAKKTTSTTAAKTAGEEDKEKPAPKKRKKATTTADTTAKAKETAADVDGTIEPATEQEGESKDAAA
jgi:small subunit ribosomal protein S3